MEAFFTNANFTFAVPTFPLTLLKIRFKTTRKQLKTYSHRLLFVYDQPN